METIFKVGMEVYDSVNYPNEKGEVIKTESDIVYTSRPIQVKFESNIENYTLDGRIGTFNQIPTLSTSPYTLQGFEQKEPVPTYEEAEEKLKCYKDKYPYYCLVSRNVVYPKSINPDVFEALRKLIILRDYYNEGWQPDWEDDESKFTIGVYENEITTGDTYCFSCVLSFKSDKVRDKFMKEQKELLEIAKPLL